MGEYRTPGSARWAPWITVVMVLAGLGAIFQWVPMRPFAGLLAWLFVLSALAAFALFRSWASWRRRPTHLRLGQNQITARRGDGSVIAEIPYAAIAAVRDRLWAPTLVVQGADGYSRIEIPLDTQGIRELLMALADRLPTYLCDLDEGRRFGMSHRRAMLLLFGMVYLFAAGCFFWIASYWLAGACAIVALVGFALVLIGPRRYEISRRGLTVRRIIGARHVPAAEVSTVQLKKGVSEAGARLYVTLLLSSGKRLVLGNTEQSALVLYRALLNMRKAA